MPMLEILFICLYLYLHFFFFFLIETGSRCVAQAGVHWLFTGAILLLISTGVLTCSVSEPGLVHPSIGNLVVPCSQEVTILMLNLGWMPDRHSALQPRIPGLK